MTAREQAIEAGARAHAERWNSGVVEEHDREAAEVVLDAAEPIIRADERERWALHENAALDAAIRAAVAEEIAQAIEKSKPNVRGGYRLISVDYAAALARRHGTAP
jgi:hypothetical protein